MLIVPFIFSYLIGWRVLRILIGHHENDLFYHFLALGIGAGITSQLAFLSLIIFNQYRPIEIIAGHMVLLLMLYCIPGKSSVAITPAKPEGGLKSIYFISIICLFLVLAVPAAFRRPFGDWDAWALWNFRANFICRSATSWSNIFHLNLHGHSPWLLPFYIAYGWAFVPAESYLFPLLTAMFFSVGTIGLLYYGLCQRKAIEKAAFSGIFLCSIPFFTQHAVSQYADILVAYYLLAAAVLVTVYARNCGRQYFLAGFLLGCAAFSKDEGLVLSLLFLASLFFYVPRVLWLALLGGFLTMMPALITVKLWMTGDPAGVNKIYLPYLLDLGRWWFVISTILKYLFTSCWWGAAWLFLMLMAWWNKKELKGALRGIFYSTVIFLFIFMALYVVVVNNLSWRLSVSVDRLFFQITPLMVYMVFSCI